jgi:hypothetical protein
MLSLLNMTREMYRKNIEISRISKTCAILLMSGLSKHDIHSGILERCLRSQREDGGFIANTDTIWNIKLLEFFPEFCDRRISAIEWLVTGNGLEKGFGRSKRDMHRIPVTGLALYLLPEIANDKELEWLERAWLSEQNSLTYKAAYTLLAFQECSYCSSRTHLMQDTVDWLLSQQQPSGGFAPWRDHPVGENVYCTAVAMLALLRVGSNSCQEAVKRARDYLHKTQLESGIWPYHEIEDGASWGLLALSQYELCIGE